MPFCRRYGCTVGASGRQGVPSVVRGAGVFLKGERFVGVRSPFRVQNFLWAFRVIKCENGEIVGKVSV